MAQATWFPRRDAPAPASALFVLGPPEVARIRQAHEIMARGGARELVVSIPSFARERASLCTERLPYPVTCFTPEPSNTRGEAMALRRMWAEKRWATVSVLTVEEHVSRTRFILSRCLTGQRAAVVGYHAEATDWWRLYQVAYQGAGYVRELLRGPC